MFKCKYVPPDPDAAIPKLLRPGVLATLEQYKERVKTLETQVVSLQTVVAGFRVGPYDPNSWYPSYRDPRPVLSLRDAIEKILAHLKLELTDKPEIPAEVILKKKGRK